jgi:hypothetical protein
MGASCGDAAWAVTKVGAWPIHWGLKPSLAAVPRMGPVFDGRAVRNTASHLAFLSWVIWAVNSWSVGSNRAVDLISNFSAWEAASKPSTPACP